MELLDIMAGMATGFALVAGACLSLVTGYALIEMAMHADRWHPVRWWAVFSVVACIAVVNGAVLGHLLGRI